MPAPCLLLRRCLVHVAPDPNGFRLPLLLILLLLLLRSYYSKTDIFQCAVLLTLLDGRVKTLHPMVHGGILAKRDTATHTASVQVGWSRLTEKLIEHIIHSVTHHNHNTVSHVASVELGSRRRTEALRSLT